MPRHGPWLERSEMPKRPVHRPFGGPFSGQADCASASVGGSEGVRFRLGLAPSLFRLASVSADRDNVQCGGLIAYDPPPVPGTVLNDRIASRENHFGAFVQSQGNLSATYEDEVGWIRGMHSRFISLHNFAETSAHGARPRT